MSKRKICVVTGGRSEYGLLYWIIKGIQDDPELSLQLVVTGMHLSPEFGLTYKVIEEQGFRIDAKADLELASDSPAEITRSMGKGLIRFAEIFAGDRPDIVILLGDRFEILTAATAAMMTRIPIAHISGGEITEGAIDDSIRHAITKMSSFHFVAAEPYRQRVIRMGEEPERVLNFGDPGLDNIVRLKLMSREDLCRDLSFELKQPTFLVTYHPVTLSDIAVEKSFSNLLSALDQFPTASIVFTKPNADAGGHIIATMIDDYAATHRDRVMVSTSLGQLRYLSLMKHCDVVIGNSSSGIVEAPALKTATVNIGTRQRGRLFATSVIDSPEKSDSIATAIQTALSEPFRKELNNTVSLYGSCNASERIVEVLKRANLSKPKRFYDGIEDAQPPDRIGGEFEVRVQMFEAPVIDSLPGIVQPHQIWLDSGRSAIRVALREILKRGGRRLAYLPAFCCDSVIAPFKQLGFHLSFYSMGSDLANPSALPREIEGSTILFIHYFGSLNGAMAQWLAQARRNHSFFVIEDCVQASLTCGIGKTGDFVITSYRKLAPQIDGALLGSDKPITDDREDPDEDFISRKLMGKLLRGASGREELFLSLLEQAEQRLEQLSEPRRISWLSDYLMRRTDFRRIATARRENWKYLDLCIRKAGIESLIDPIMHLREDEVPLGYPVRVLNGARDDLRGHLSRHRVYCPVHWPISREHDVVPFRADWELSQSILTIPIDQRLGERELARITESIASFANGTQR